MVPGALPPPPDPEGSLSPERFARLNRIVRDALSLDGADRAAFLDRACGEDAGLRRMAESMLDRETFPGVLDPETMRPTEAVTASVAPTASRDLPDRIGPYRILGKLGEGGMGVVFLAEQQSPRRQVALKVIRGGRFVDDMQLRMFQREIDTLARLKHPDIASIFESGRTEEGRHYFAMELVQGQTLQEYLRSRMGDGALTDEEVRHRVRLFRRIVSAVHYAHQRGVIHRDLKPSNVVVVAGGDEGDGGSPDVPPIKILDFGLARITDSDVEASFASEVGMIKGTLPYMSPEQARGDPGEIDVRTDVYSLGVIFHEMLTGELPKRVPSGSIAAAVRAITETTARPPREAFRGTRPLDPDVDTICMKALENDPARRFQSAAALSEDIERWLTDQPIQARPPSTAYRMRKFVRRHRMPVALVSALFLLAVGSAITMGFLWHGQVRERERAEVEAARARRVSSFLSETLESVSPDELRGNELTVSYLLDRARERAGTELAQDPEVLSEIRQTLGRTYLALAEYGKADSMLVPALDARRGIFGERSAETSRALNDLALLRWDVGDLDDAERLYREALAIDRELSLDDRTATDLNNLGALLREAGRLDEAETTLREALEIKRGLYGEDHLEVAEGIYNLAAVLFVRGRPDEAEPLYRQAMEMHVRFLGPDHPDVTIIRSDLAGVLRDLGRTDEAEALLREVVDTYRRVYGERHPKVGTALHNLGWALFSAGKKDEALESFRAGLDIRREVLGEDHPYVAISLGAVARGLAETGRTAEALEAYRSTLALQARTAGRDHPETLITMYSLSRCLIGAGDLAAADSVLVETCGLAQEALGDQLITGVASVLRGETLTGLQRYAEAETALTEGLRILDVVGGQEQRVQDASSSLIDLYDRWGRPDEAAAWRERLATAGPE